MHFSLPNHINHDPANSPWKVNVEAVLPRENGASMCPLMIRHLPGGCHEFFTSTGRMMAAEKLFANR